MGAQGEHLKPGGADLSDGLEAIVARAERAGGTMAVVVRDLATGARYERRADEPFVAASTIKLPILVALYDAAARGEVGLAQPCRLVPEDQVTGSGVLQLLSPGARLPLRDLAELMITVSDNAATNMLLDRLGTARVNACLDALGLTRTRVFRKLQVIPTDIVQPNTVTAGELADLLERLARGRAVSYDASRRMIATLKRQQINDALPALLPDPEDDEGGPVGALPDWQLAHKTGGIPGYQHDVGILYLPRATAVICVLTRGCGPSRDARGLIAAVGRAVFDSYQPTRA